MGEAADICCGGIRLEVRSDFLARRGLNRWNDPGDDWPRRGAEQAAEIIAWGLQEEVGPIPTRVGLVGPQSLDDLATAFELLVGAPPLWMEADFGSSKPTGTWHMSSRL